MDGKVKIKTRIAPTPSGFLHKGNVFSLLLTWLIARKNNGDILLRIDDLDQDRVRTKYIADIFRTLEWLRLDYDEGPSGPDSLLREYSQTRRIDLYHEAIGKLVLLPHTTFQCECSRKTISKQSIDGNYPGTCLDKNLTHENTAIRFITEEDGLMSFNDDIQGKVTIPAAKKMRHFILQKKDSMPSYQIASLIDDSHFGINTIVRGNDLIYSTAAQLLLSEKLRSRFINSQFFHHPLVTMKNRKLSKSQGDGGLEKSAKSRTALLHEFCAWIGLNSPLDRMDDILQRFSVDHLKHLRPTDD